MLRLFFGWITVCFYNLFLIIKVISPNDAAEAMTSVCLESIYKKLEAKIIGLHKKYPNDVDLKRDLIKEICKSSFLEMRLFIGAIIWKKALAESISKDLEKSFMRKISWNLRCEGFLLEVE